MITIDSGITYITRKCHFSVLPLPTCRCATKIGGGIVFLLVNFGTTGITMQKQKGPAAGGGGGGEENREGGE